MAALKRFFRVDRESHPVYQSRVALSDKSTIQMDNRHSSIFGCVKVATPRDFTRNVSALGQTVPFLARRRLVRRPSGYHMRITSSGGLGLF